MVDKPRSRQFTIEHHGDTLRILIPIPKIWFSLVAWGGMVVVSFCMVASGEPLFVALFGVFGLLLIIWNFLRQQIVEVSDQYITVSDDVLGIRMRPKHYLAENIRELRISTDTTNGLVAFDYGSATVTFGKGLDSTGALEIVSEIQRRFPRYQRDYSHARLQPANAFDKVPIPLPRILKGIEAPPLRHRSEDLENRLRITIPSVKKWPMIIFFIFWLILWSFGGIFAVRVMTRGEYKVFLIVWIIIWFVAEIIGIYHMMWQLFGQEKIEVTADSIIIRQSILGIGPPKIYTREHISQIRVDITGRVEPYALADEGVSLSKGTGLIAFDYKNKTIRMGIGIDEAEAKYLVAKIQRHYPDYIYKSG